MNARAPVYPESGRTAWILAQRPQRVRTPDPFRPHGVFLEQEVTAEGVVGSSGVVLLTNRECPWRCVMCDLWKDTTLETVPEGAIARQVAGAVSTWREAGALPAQVKLYNSGSFFDAASIPLSDYEPVAREVAFARRVVVESHPLLVGKRTRRLRDLLAGTLEVAMGLETAHPDVLEKLNKKFDLGQFEKAARFLADERVALRVFLLVSPPFLAPESSLEWTVKSAQFAFDCGATAVTLIPTRPGNGALDRLLETGKFVPPTLGLLEQCQRAVLALGRGRVFSDTWALEPFAACPACFAGRKERLEKVNLTQHDQPGISCACCGNR